MVVGLLIKLDISLLGYAVAFPLLYISFEIIHSLLTSHLGTFLLDYFDTLALKRLNALIYSGARMGSISAAAVASGLLAFVGTEVLLWVAVGSLILASAVVQLIQRTQATLAPAARAAEDEEEESISWRDWSWLRDAPLVWVIAASFFALNLIEWIVDFQTNSLFEQRYPTEEALATFYSTFSAGSDIIGLLLQLFVLSRLIARLGVGLANVIHPAATFLVSGIFTFGHAFIPAVAARFVLMPLSESVQDPTSDLLYNALPRDRRGRTRAFISGVVTPVGTIVGSLLILTLDRWFSTFVLSGAGLFFAGSYLALAFWQRRKYTASLVSLLHTEDLHLDSFAINGLDRNRDNNGAKSLGARLGFTPTKRLNFGVTSVYGAERDDDTGDQRLLLDFNYTIKPTEKLLVGGDLQYGREENHPFVGARRPGGDATWFAWLVTTRYDFTDRFGITLRFDYVHDDDGALVADFGAPLLSTAGGQVLKSLTFAPSFRLRDNLLGVFEYRHDRSNRATFLERGGPGAHETRDGIAFELTYIF